MRLGLLEDPAVRSAMALELGRGIEYHRSIGSTQDRARDLARSSIDPFVIVADEQTRGAGTHGRSWLAHAGTSLLASWSVRPAPTEPSLFALLAGVAVARAFEAVGVPNASVKWPNDVELDRKKVAGALAHASSDGKGSSLVLGIGVNVHQRAEDFPGELGSTATSLALAGHRVDRLALLARLTREIDRIAVADERAAALQEWRRRARMLGRRVEVDRESGSPIRGVATGVDVDGALLVGSERILNGRVREIE